MTVHVRQWTLRLGTACLLAATALGAAGVAAAEPFNQQCGPFPDNPRLTVANWNPTIDCGQAIGVVRDFLNKPSTLRGDKGGAVGAFGCNIFGAAEAEKTGHVVECAAPSGSVYLVGPNPRSPRD